MAGEPTPGRHNHKVGTIGVVPPAAQRRIGAHRAHRPAVAAASICAPGRRSNAISHRLRARGHDLPARLSPNAFAHCSAGTSRARSAAACADRVSFHSRAGRTISRPRQGRSSVPPCCGPVMLTAATSGRPPAVRTACCGADHQACGSISVPFGGVARPWTDQPTGFGVADDDLVGLGGRVHSGYQGHLLLRDRSARSARG